MQWIKQIKTVHVKLLHNNYYKREHRPKTAILTLRKFEREYSWRTRLKEIKEKRTAVYVTTSMFKVAKSKCGKWRGGGEGRESSLGVVTRGDEEVGEHCELVIREHLFVVLPVVVVSAFELRQRRLHGYLNTTTTTVTFARRWERMWRERRTCIGWGSLTCVLRSMSTRGTSGGTSYGKARTHAHNPNTPAWRRRTLSVGKASGGVPAGVNLRLFLIGVRARPSKYLCKKHPRTFHDLSPADEEINIWWRNYEKVVGHREVTTVKKTRESHRGRLAHLKHSKSKNCPIQVKGQSDAKGKVTSTCSSSMRSLTMRSMRVFVAGSRIR